MDVLHGPKGRDGNGLAGVNVNNGRTEREIRLSDLDDRFVTDEAFNVLYSASGNKLFGHRLNWIQTEDHDLAA